MVFRRCILMSHMPSTEYRVLVFTTHRRLLVSVRRFVIWRVIVAQEIVERLLHSRERHVVVVRRQRADELDEHGAQVRTEAAKKHGALAAAKQECQDRHVRLGAVALGASEHEVIATIVRTLPAPGCDVIERDGLGGNTAATIRADRAVLLNEPAARFSVSGTACGD